MSDCTTSGGGGKGVGPAAKLLGVVVVLQGLTLLGQWTGASAVQPARAQIPDAGAQRAAVVEELKAVNEKLDRLIGLLEGGDLQVKVSSSDEKVEGGRAAPAARVR